ncbi:hypothetical protein [Anaerolinea sp.]|uniref:hypothetical protein n=1 Tax=Anaerolinea sp. TaxID=1872519 RepID=UPI002ACE18FC|nr:hypothetical protein [Anaerolinea sp.]
MLPENKGISFSKSNGVLFIQSPLPNLQVKPNALSFTKTPKELWCGASFFNRKSMVFTLKCSTGNWNFLLKELSMDSNVPQDILLVATGAVLAYEKMRMPAPASITLFLYVLWKEYFPGSKTQKHFDNEGIKKIASETFDNLLNEVMEIPALNAYDTARFVLSLGYLITREDSLRKISVCLSQTNNRLFWFNALLFLAKIAGLHLLIERDRYKYITYNGAHVFINHLPEEEVMLTYPQLIEWYLHSAPRELIEYHQFKFPYWFPFEYDMENTDQFDWDFIEATTEQLIHDAKKNKCYVPYGTFRVELPYPINGVESLFVLADPKGFWVSPYEKGTLKIGSSFRFSPDAPERIDSVMCANYVGKLLDLTLSALWHDLVVAGEASIYPKQRSSQRKQFSEISRNYRYPPRKPVAPHSPTPARTLPSIHLKDNGIPYNWGSPEEKERIIRNAHHVRGFIRRLPPSWKASEEAKQQALFYGIALPDEYTFVRPHIRGGKTEELEKDKPVLIRSKGLATLSLIFNKETSK